MKRFPLSMITILTFCGIGLIASPATALDGPAGERNGQLRSVDS